MASDRGPRVGEPAPAFSLPDHQGNEVRLEDFRGRKVVLYFYPKDDTPGCTREACAFNDGAARLAARGAVVLGVSPDPPASHVRFREKYALGFPLLSDQDHRTARAYGVWKKKTSFGTTTMGIERTTFLIDEQGTLTRVFPQVKVDGHLEEVLAAL